MCLLQKKENNADIWGNLAKCADGIHVNMTQLYNINLLVLKYSTGYLLHTRTAGLFLHLTEVIYAVLRMVIFLV